MKKLLLLATVCVIATGASAIDLKPYVEGRLTYTFSDVKFSNPMETVTVDQNVLGGAVAFGTAIDQFRVEVEGFHNGKKESSVQTTKVEPKAYGIFINGYYDLTNVNGIRPYVGGGIGYSWLKTKLTTPRRSASVKDKDWGYNVGFGFAYDIQDNTAITLGYRYENLGTAKIMGMKEEFKGNKISLGLRYTF